MKTSQLEALLTTAFPQRLRVLVKGKPGIGKTDIVKATCKRLDYDLVIKHPAVEDPTDYKGMPCTFISAGQQVAEFLPFGEMARLLKADRPTVLFVDDIGQASLGVQAALMQPLHGGLLNGFKMPECVVWCGATNDTTHAAGVSGFIEPLKSRWDTIVELEVSLDEWCGWAIDNDLPNEVVSFVRFRPELLSKFEPTKQLKNSPSPRGWASVARWVKAGVQLQEVFAGAVGEGAAIEFSAFLKLHNELPNLDAILLNPSTARLPTKPAAMYAVCGGLARKATVNNFAAVITYLKRLNAVEFETFAVKDAVRRDQAIACSPSFAEWCVKNSAALT